MVRWIKIYKQNTMNKIRSIKTTVAIVDPYEEIHSAYLESEQEYNEEGHLTSEVRYNERGIIISKRIFELSPDGSILAQMNYERNTDLIERTEFFDDYEQVQYKTEVTGADGTKTIQEYHYNQLGNTDRITVKNEQGEIEGYEIFVFNENDQPIEEIKLDANHQVEFKKVITYDVNGQLITEIYFDKEQPVRTVAYSYTEKGLAFEKTDISHDTDAKIVNRYSYDLAGNQVLDETFQNGQLIFKNYCTYDDRDNLVEERVINLGPENYIELRQHKITYQD